MCGDIEKPKTTAAPTAETVTTATAAATKATTSTSITVLTAGENEKQDKKQEDSQAQKGLLEADSDGAEPTLKRQGTLRRKYNIHRGKQNGNSHHKES